MKCEEVVFILDMAPRMKRTLTRAERKRIQKANAKWVREMKELARKGVGNEKVVKVEEVAKRKIMTDAGQIEKPAKTMARRRMMALREIRKY